MHDKEKAVFLVDLAKYASHFQASLLGCQKEYK
jgi:hypothetical protein